MEIITTMRIEENDVTTNQPYHETYNRIEYAEDGPYHKGKFKKTDEVVNTDGKDDCYHSVFLQSEEIVKYFNTNFINGHKSIAGYSGAVWAKELIIDFDIDKAANQKDLELLLDDLRKLLKQLENVYELDLRYIRVNFSGHKGFHIRIPAILFGGFIPSKELPAQLKSLAGALIGEMKLDTRIYSHTFYIRYINSRNSKSNLCAIPLSAAEIFNLNIDDIKSLAKEPREIEYIPVEELEPNRELVKLKETMSEQKETFKVNLSNVILVQDSSIWLGVEEGKRNKTLASIVGYLINKKIDPAIIISILKLWNAQCNPAESEKTVVDHTLSLIKDYGKGENDYWSINKEGKVVFSLVNYRKYLEGVGFAKIYLGDDYVFVKIKENRMKQVSLAQIKDYVLQEVRTSADPDSEKIEEALLQRNSSLLGEKLIECVGTIEPAMNIDTSHKAKFFFNNAVVEVNREEIELVDYKKSGKLIWEPQIIQRDISLLDSSDERNKSDFERFIFNVAGRDQDNFLAFQTAIGYLLHSFKDSSNAKVVVLCDQKLTDFPDGRTGKSLFGKAISKVKRSVRIDGKNFNFNSRFTFQQVDLDTQVLEFNDVKNDFDFENLFSVVTDDMTIENKGQKPFVIPFDKSPKILASTNFTIRGFGSSYRDRLFEIEFCDFYNEQHRPIDDFGKRYFDDWDEPEWNKFYNFMFRCVSIYLREGLVSPKNENLQLRKLIDSTKREFVEFMDEQDLSEGENKKTLYENFKKEYPDFFWLKQNTFSKWLKSYCNIKGLKLFENRSNGQTYITIQK